MLDLLSAANWGGVELNVWTWMEMDIMEISGRANSNV